MVIDYVAVTVFVFDRPVFVNIVVASIYAA